MRIKDNSSVIYGIYMQVKCMVGQSFMKIDQDFEFKSSSAG